jgi:hypothetical protein
MESRALIKKVLEFDNAPRIGYELHDGNPNDFVYFGLAKKAGYDYEWHTPEHFSSEYPDMAGFHGYLRKDEFGNLWGKMLNDPSPQGEVMHGVFKEWEDLENYSFPRLSDPERFVHIEKAVSANKDKFRIGSLPGFPFAIMRYMRKMEYFLADLILEKERVFQLNETVMKELLGIIDIYSDLGIDSIMTWEDWGTQDRLLISPALWREMFRPSFEKICSHAHKKGLYVFMHSCGYIYEILPDLIDTGIDLFQFDQPTLMGMERVAELFRKRATLFAPADIQKVLPTGDRGLIEKNVDDMIRLFGSQGGGFICKDYGDYRTIQVGSDAVRIMRERFIQKGGWADV